jgi:hypothetical protein
VLKTRTRKTKIEAKAVNVVVEEETKVVYLLDLRRRDVFLTALSFALLDGQTGTDATTSSEVVRVK